MKTVFFACVPGLARADWPLEDPKGRPLDDVRRIREDIRTRVAALLSTAGWERPTAPSSGPSSL